LGTISNFLDGLRIFVGAARGGSINERRGGRYQVKMILGLDSKKGERGREESSYS